MRAPALQLPLPRWRNPVLKYRQPGPYSINGSPLPTFRHVTLLPSPRQRASSPPVTSALGKTDPHLLWAEGHFRRLLRKSGGVGKKKTRRRWAKDRKAWREVRKCGVGNDRKLWKIREGGRGDEYCIRSLRLWLEFMLCINVWRVSILSHANLAAFLCCAGWCLRVSLPLFLCFLLSLWSGRSEGVIGGKHCCCLKGSHLNN